MPILRFTLASLLLWVNLGIFSAEAEVGVKPDPFSDPTMRAIQARHDKAVKGESWDDEKAFAADLEKMRKEQPTNYLVQVYLGSTYTLLSRDCFPGPSKYSYLKDGLKNMDDAVVSAPNNPAVRLIRAINYLNLPAIFGRRQTARNDFIWLMHRVDGQEKSEYHFEASTAQAVYYYAGISLDQLSEHPNAVVCWKKGQTLDPVSELGLKLEKLVNNSGD